MANGFDRMERNRILVAEDESVVAEDIQRMLQNLAYEGVPVASTGEGALRLAGEMRPDLVLMDIILKGRMDGIEAASAINSRFDIPVVFMTADGDEKGHERIVDQASFSRIRKPFQEQTLYTTVEMALYTHRAEKELAKSIEKLLQSIEGTVNALASIVEMRDPYTAGHQRRVAQLACAIGEMMKLPEEQIEGLRVASLIHDIGKINVPSEILGKPSALNDVEFRLVMTHPQAGWDIIREIEFPWPVADTVMQHHERLNGSGYPGKLDGNAIILEARILAVADVMEAMMSHRPYRPSLGTREALEEISRHSGELYDSEIVDICTRVVSQKDWALE